MISIQTNVLGCFALKDGKIIYVERFPPDEKIIAKKLRDISQGKIIDEEKKIIKKLVESKNREIHVSCASRFKDFQDASFLELRSEIPVEEIASQLGIPREELTELIRKVNLELTKLKLREIPRDNLIIQAINTLNELDEEINKLSERLVEWYSLHFPELKNLAKDKEYYANIILGRYDAVPKNLLKKIEKFKDETYLALNDKDLLAIRSLAELLLNAISTREKIEKYISDIMREIAPNLSSLAGPILGARLIALAGSLERLSKLPASTIQILGAEEAFFKFLRGGKKLPKHGVIFLLPEIRNAKKKLRGKIARTFAAKVAIAAKVDFFGGEFVGDKLREEFLRRVREVSKEK